MPAKGGHASFAYQRYFEPERRRSHVDPPGARASPAARRCLDRGPADAQSPGGGLKTTGPRIQISACDRANAGATQGGPVVVLGERVALACTHRLETSHILAALGIDLPSDLSAQCPLRQRAAQNPKIDANVSNGSWLCGNAGGAFSSPIQASFRRFVRTLALFALLRRLLWAGERILVAC